MVTPLPTVMGLEFEMDWGEVKLPGLEDMWDDASVSRNHSAVCSPVGGAAVVFRVARRACCSIRQAAAWMQ
jgi:hypothetical protein